MFGKGARMNCLLSLHNVTKHFSPLSAPVVHDVSLEVNAGEIFALLGPSGCGKTTTLRLIVGFERVDSGEIRLEDKCIESRSIHAPPESRQIGFVFQDYALFPHLDVLDNVTFGLKKLAPKVRSDRGLEALEMVGLAEFRNRKPHDLSGGEQQRVALARSIAPSPKLILLDEPFSNLDAGLRQATRKEVRQLLKDAGMSAILVTHDREEALSFADRVAVMENGSLKQTGAPEAVYNHPKTPFVAEFLGKTNLIPGDARGDYAETDLGTFKIDCHATGRALLSIRPEHLTMIHAAAGDKNAKFGKIVEREFKGHDLTYRVQVEGKDYFVQTDYRCPYQIGDWVQLKAVEPGVVLDEQWSKSEA